MALKKWENTRLTWHGPQVCFLEACLCQLFINIPTAGQPHSFTLTKPLPRKWHFAYPKLNKDIRVDYETTNNMCIILHFPNKRNNCDNREVTETGLPEPLAHIDESCWRRNWQWDRKFFLEIPGSVSLWRTGNLFRQTLYLTQRCQKIDLSI